MRRKDKRKIVEEIKFGVGIKEKCATILNAVSALGLAIVSLIIGFNLENHDWLYYTLLVSFIILCLIGAASIILLLCNLKSIEKYQEEYNYYTESKRVSDALLTAIKRTDYAKTSSILRSTYGSVPEWNPINYCQNVLVYDVHEQLRKICVQIKQMIVSLAPSEFNDDMVTVDIAFRYPSDKNLKKPEANKTLTETDRDRSETEEDKRVDGWKIITSGDRTSLDVNLHEYIANKWSFYKHLETVGYAFCSDKEKLNKENHYLWTSKDNEYGRVGSIVGSVVQLKNDHPEVVFVEAYVTVSTYGRRLAEDCDLLGEEEFEKLFKETIINSYKTIIESEMAQMFIRHGVREGFIDRMTGRLLTGKDSSGASSEIRNLITPKGCGFNGQQKSAN